MHLLDRTYGILKEMNRFPLTINKGWKTWQDDIKANVDHSLIRLDKVKQ